MLQREQKAKIVWIKAHIGIPGNEKADMKAREATLKRTTPDYNLFPLSFAKKMIRENTIREWNERYVKSSTGSTTRLFLPDIRSALSFLRLHQPTYKLTQAMTGHGCFNEYLHRFKLTDDDINDTCPCDDTSKQDVVHLILTCPIFGYKRSQMEAVCRRHNLGLEDISKIIKSKDI